VTSGLLVAGTTSDAGKSIVATGLCRAFRRRGIRVAPYKAQNMSNNSMVCPDGGEIGRAQWIQARAAGAAPEVAMNPVLLKPGDDRTSHVVLMGRPAGSVSSANWREGRAHLARVAHDAYDDLAARFDLVVAEGAGSPTEINLRDGDYVNLGLARHARIPALVVGDIDRGGLFAAMYGTVALLEPADQVLVAGFIVNKFRGDLSLLAPGLDELTRLTGRPTYGVLPWHQDLWLDSEDALDLAGRRATTDGALRVAVVRLPRISNFTDVDALGLEPDLDVVFAASPRDLAGADLVVLPGTRATLADLAWLRHRGLDEAIVKHAGNGGSVLGICGGAQMLGRTISDPAGVEGDPGSVGMGLGLLDLSTTFGPEKVLRAPTGEGLGHPVSGYEIHHGRLDLGSVDPFPGGGHCEGVFATMWHGSLESDGFRQAFLADVAARAGGTREPSEVVFAERREARLDLLGDLVEQHLDVDRLLELARSGPAPGLPVLPPGSSR
jgi:adenosylcobyric acid synthase